MHENATLIERFYRSFQARDAEQMSVCYHDQVVFADPVFPDLRGEHARTMWRMLCARAADLEVSFSNVVADEQSGRAHWEARYTFSQTGRKVHNVIDATFRFRDGLIVEHHDRFDFWRWSRMALGPTGVLLGWTPLLRSAVRRKAAHGLDLFRQKGAG